MTDAPQLNAAAFEGAMFAFIREVVITAGKPGLLERVDAGGIDEARKYMAKNPDAVREVSAAITAYLGATR